MVTRLLNINFYIKGVKFNAFWVVIKVFSIVFLFNTVLNWNSFTKEAPPKCGKLIGLNLLPHGTSDQRAVASVSWDSGEASIINISNDTYVKWLAKSKNEEVCIKQLSSNTHLFGVSVNPLLYMFMLISCSIFIGLELIHLLTIFINKL